MLNVRTLSRGIGRLRILQWEWPRRSALEDHVKSFVCLARHAGLAALVCIVITAVPSRAIAQTSVETGSIEVGTSLFSTTVLMPEGRGKNTLVFGSPSAEGAFGFNTPNIFIAWYATPQLLVKPQVGLLFASDGDDVAHVLNVSGQVDYLLHRTRPTTPYIFGSAGFVSSSLDPVEKTVSAGAGYRIAAGDRLVFRLEGRYTHTAVEHYGNNGLAFVISIGGLFPSH